MKKGKDARTLVKRVCWMCHRKAVVSRLVFASKTYNFFMFESDSGIGEHYLLVS
jgi:hypothetical protein